MPPLEQRHTESNGTPSKRDTPFLIASLLSAPFVLALLNATAILFLDMQGFSHAMDTFYVAACYFVPSPYGIVVLLAATTSIGVAFARKPSSLRKLWALRCYLLLMAFCAAYVVFWHLWGKGHTIRTTGVDPF